MSNIKEVKVSEFVQTKYKEFWKESNRNRNVFLPEEQLMAVEKRIIWAAHKIGMTNLNKEYKTTDLSGETAKYHIAGQSTIDDSIKGLAAPYKRQSAVRLFGSESNMGSFQGDSGAASRYTSVMPTPLLLEIMRDLEYVDLVIDETGLEEPKYISSPLPMSLINGFSPIGLGHAAYYDERDASEIIDWIEKLQKDPNAPLPDPISSTGCIVYKNPKNGYTYYDAVINREGNRDVITALPPKVSTKSVLHQLKSKLPTRTANLVIDASGKGEAVKIMLPTGHITDKNRTKFGLRTARIEAPYIWDESIDTMRMSSHAEIANIWLAERKVVVERRLRAEIEKHKAQIHKIDLLQRFADEEMNKWKIEDIQKALGEEDTNMVLSQAQRAFLPENLAKNNAQKPRLKKLIKEAENNIKRIEEFIFDEARDIIKRQEEHFKKN